MKSLTRNTLLLLTLVAGGVLVAGGGPVPARGYPVFESPVIAFEYTEPAHPDNPDSVDPPAGEVITPSHGDRINPETGQLESVPIDTPPTDFEYTPPAHVEDGPDVMEPPSEMSAVKWVAATGLLVAVVAAGAVAIRRRANKA